MQLAGVVDDGAELLAELLVLAGKIALVDQHAVAHDQHRMGVRLGPGVEARPDRAQLRAVEALHVGCGDLPAVAEIGRGRAGFRGGGERGEQYHERDKYPDAPTSPLIPAQAGIQGSRSGLWIPAFAGMSGKSGAHFSGMHISVLNSASGTSVGSLR